jgi:myo-inositol-1-phosphate synthase
VLIPGMGAVTTTFIAGWKPSSAAGQADRLAHATGTIRLGKRTEGRSPAIKDFVPLANIGRPGNRHWDIFEDNATKPRSSRRAGDAAAGKLKEPLRRSSR